MDQDTTIGRNAHAQILARFEQGEAHVLIGTQMIAKGHDFANVTVVGVLAADLMLGMSDFRSSERAFQLITQAAGRAGRGREPGTVVIQAYNIDDYAIRFAAAQDYPGFFRQEIAYRRLMQYPPFGSICVITVTSLQEQEAKESCDGACESAHLPDPQPLSPAPGHQGVRPGSAGCHDHAAHRTSQFRQSGHCA
jgi:primosomal protein N' (replication factor Y)